MSAVLGVSGGYHDAAACLIVDGVVVAAIQEERLSRVKNDPSLPFRAARACLELGGLQAHDLEQVVFYENPFLKLERVLVSHLRAFPSSMLQFPRALRSQWSHHVWVLDHLAEGLGVERTRVSYREHHESHAASAFFVSPFESAAVVTVDGVGEYQTTGIFRGDGKHLKLLEQVDYPHSLGLLYSALTAFLGFEVNEGEYKVMGLAAYGTPRFADEFARLLRVAEDGSFELDLRYFDFGSGALGFHSRLETLLGARRAYGAPLDLTQETGRRLADIAASLQARVTEALLAIARRARRLTGSQNLCLAGGVSLNALANRALLKEAGFERVFVQPAAGDAGAALGAAVLGALELGDARPGSMMSAALGMSCDLDRAKTLGARMGLRSTRLSDPIAFAAQALEAGEVLAWVQGRTEFGPRALGQRSLLCCAHDPAMREHLNVLVKKREPFRPFAPVVLSSACEEWFVDPPNDMSPFMTVVNQTRSPQALAAVTHVDGTARVQSVDDASGSMLAQLLGAMKQRGLPPVLLNTSLNGAGDPIANTEADALAFLQAHGVSKLIMEDTLFERSEAQK